MIILLVSALTGSVAGFIVARAMLSKFIKHMEITDAEYREKLVDVVINTIKKQK